MSLGSRLRERKAQSMDGDKISGFRAPTIFLFIKAADLYLACLDCLLAITSTGPTPDVKGLSVW